MSQRRLPRIAIGAAAVALALAVTASIVAHRRAGDAGLVARRVRAEDAAKLAAATAGADGVRVSDNVSATKLGLASRDRVVALSGRRITSASDLRAALAALAALAPSTWFVEIERDGARQLERWELEGALPPDPARDDALRTTIQRTGKTDYALPRATIDACLRDLPRCTAGVAGARAVANGFALGSVRPGSIAAALGLETGDVIRGIDGDAVALDSVAAAVARSSARIGASITLDLMRGDRAVILRYAIQ